MRGAATAVYLLGATLIGLSLGPFTAGFVSEATGSLGRGVMTTLLIVPLGLGAVWTAVRKMPRPVGA
jgi:ABC-type sugar transport system permease subunit